MSNDRLISALCALAVDPAAQEQPVVGRVLGSLIDLLQGQGGDFCDDVDLAQLARRVLEEKGLTQQEAADRLGVTQPYVSYALDPDKPSISGRRRILEEIGGYRVTENPKRWKVHRVEKR